MPIKNTCNLHRHVLHLSHCGRAICIRVQVFECIQALLKSDPDVVVKRSAAVCSTLLLRGLSKDCLKVVIECCYCQMFVTDL